MTEKLSIIGVANKEGNFETLTQALAATGLDNIIRDQGPFTMFAPTDEAFKQLSEFGNLTKPDSKQKLKELLSNHLIKGKLMSKDLIKQQEFKTLAGGTLTVDTEDDLKINEVKIAKSDLEATNGVIHVVDRILMPRTAMQTASA